MAYIKIINKTSYSQHFKQYRQAGNIVIVASCVQCVYACKTCCFTSYNEIVDKNKNKTSVKNMQLKVVKGSRDGGARSMHKRILAGKINIANRHP